jgi:hypothetical protein
MYHKAYLFAYYPTSYYIAYSPRHCVDRAVISTVEAQNEVIYQLEHAIAMLQRLIQCTWHETPLVDSKRSERITLIGPLVHVHEDAFAGIVPQEFQSSSHSLLMRILPRCLQWDVVGSRCRMP